MKKQKLKKKYNWKALAVVFVLIAIIVFSIVAMRYQKSDSVGRETAECIGQRATLYSSKTCSACATQKELFGSNFRYLTTVDCINVITECQLQNITRVPTWIIDGEKYPGVQSIEWLRNKTGC